MNNETCFVNFTMVLYNIVVELLQKSCVRAKDTNEILLRVLEQPVTSYLPISSRIIGELYCLVLQGLGFPSALARW